MSVNPYATALRSLADPSMSRQQRRELDRKAKAQWAKVGAELRRTEKQIATGIKKAKREAQRLAKAEELALQRRVMLAPYGGAPLLSGDVEQYLKDKGIVVAEGEQQVLDLHAQGVNAIYFA